MVVAVTAVMASVALETVAMVEVHLISVSEVQPSAIVL